MSDLPPRPSELAENPPRWVPLNPQERRVLGVLVEKAKTTPDVYPLTLNAMKSGCNQKSNRSPTMSLEIEDIEETIDSLREKGAVAEVLGSGRVEKYRHFAYEWFGVGRVEVAILAELLLRGEQTLGELRARTSRMEKIADLDELKGYLDTLIEQNLVIELSPKGRGQLVTHGLYSPVELDRLKIRLERNAGSTDSSPSTSAPASASPGVVPNADALEKNVAELTQQVASLQAKLESMEAKLSSYQQAFEELKAALGE
ncbi:Virulence factor mviM [Planctomycetales bacterium 10988]|nr:Virulence factor mviM [Planctomycetales bacterium 10988]